jgi:hypothetical protein
MHASELVEHAGAADELARRNPDLARAIGACLRQRHVELLNN